MISLMRRRRSQNRNETMSDSPSYPPGTVRALLQSDHVSPATRRVLVERMSRVPTHGDGNFFPESEYSILRAICARLTGADSLSSAVDVAQVIDTRLARGETDGWRFADHPNDGQAWRVAIAAINALAHHDFSDRFTFLSGDQQDAILAAVQIGDRRAGDWQGVDPRYFFTDLLAEVAETFYGHPLVQEEIGYVGMADLPRWQAIGLNRLDDREPRPIPDHHDRS